MSAEARLDLRLDPKDKVRIERAADLRGVPVSAFVRDAVLREADNVVAAGAGARHSLIERMRGRATSRLSTEQIMKLTRGAA
ncbi:MAG TPA: DUF1778 domain-containing protein [Rhodanobacteraceae bacterium]|nr:DUF1778 domain-containing protein [Rhodanobacteraceae bacterium]